MESLGEYLRTRRVAHGVSLEEVARVTRVTSGYLEALERDCLAQLPAPAFTKGFIRAYCQALGEPWEEAISRYMTALSEGQPPGEPRFGAAALRRSARGPVFVSALLLVALGFALYLVNLGLGDRVASGVSARTRPAATPSSRFTPPALPTPVTSVMAPVAVSARSRLVARTIEPTWIRVQIGNATATEELLPAGVTREWVSGERFVLTIGNAGGISLELNGEPLPRLGDRGGVIRQLVLPQRDNGPEP